MNILFVSLAFLIIFSGLAFWKPNSVLFMINAGIALMLGLSSYDFFTDKLGLTIGLMLVVYAFFCIAMAFRMSFWEDERNE